MKNNFFPPVIWFDTAIEIVDFAKKNRHKGDFITDSKLRPQIIGQSFSYRIDVMQELVKAGLVEIQDDRLVIGNTINVEWLSAALEAGNPNAWDFAVALGIDEKAEKKFDTQALKRIGDMGENFVLEELRKHHPSELHRQIEHVAKYDDTLGYDISSPSISNSDKNSLLEVKTSVRQISGKFEFYLSRNEFEIGKVNRNWCIVAISVVNNIPAVIGHLYIYQIESSLPRDIDKSAKWESSKLSIKLEAFRPGLP